MRRGSLLVGALLLVALLLLLVLASLGRREARGKALAELRARAEARQLAEAGMADVLAKLNLDINFPPPVLAEDQLFSYTEPVRGFDGEIRGYYTITIDGRYLDPYQILQIRSVGRLGPDRGRSVAEAQLSGDFDLAPEIRGTTNPNPFFYQFRTWSP